MTLAKAFEDEPKLRALAEDARYKDLFEIARKLENKNRHTSFHAAGIVIGKTALTGLRAAVQGPEDGHRRPRQYTMDYLEKCGLVKMDFLGLKTLTLIKHTIDLVRKRGVEIEEDEIPEDDETDLRHARRGQVDLGLPVRVDAACRASSSRPSPPAWRT